MQSAKIEREMRYCLPPVFFASLIAPSRTFRGYESREEEEEETAAAAARSAHFPALQPGGVGLGRPAAALTVSREKRALADTDTGAALVFV